MCSTDPRTLTNIVKQHLHKPKVPSKLRDCISISNLEPYADAQLRLIQPEEKQNKAIPKRRKLLTVKQKRLLAKSAVLVKCGQPRLRARMLLGGNFVSKCDQELSVDQFWEAYNDHSTRLTAKR